MESEWNFIFPRLETYPERLQEGGESVENVAGIDAKALVFHWFYCYLAIPGPSGSESAMDSIGINAEIDGLRIEFHLISEKVEWNRKGILHFLGWKRTQNGCTRVQGPWRMLLESMQNHWYFVGFTPIWPFRVLRALKVEWIPLESMLELMNPEQNST